MVQRLQRTKCTCDVHTVYKEIRLRKLLFNTPDVRSAPSAAALVGPASALSAVAADAPSLV